MFMRKSEDFDGSRGQQGSRGLDKDLERIPNTLLSSMWSSDGLGSSNRLFQRSNSTPPTHLEDPKATRQAAKCNAHSQFQLSRFTLRESVEENNQEDELVESGRDDLLLGGKHIQRSWSAPPVPDNIDDIFSRATRENETHHISLLNIDDVDTLSSSTDLKASKFAHWNPSRREEFKGASKADKWDLTTIRGHLIQFARDQTGSRFIQQRLEKADEQARSEAFAEIFPHALLLMTDVFGNYVIQKLFDHGSVEQQRLLVNQMKKNMVSLALQVYGCRVIQKALEVTQVEEQLVLIRELKNHVLKCVVDQNGNHVLQKCIEAASWKKGGVRVFGSERRVTGEDIQFIIDDFVGQAAALSMHAYGCRVIQRVLEHCAHDQIRPIVNEIIFKCRDLVKDQFGNYVVQHVIVHGELEHRNIVMQTICPEIAKWSQHKYASNVVEACLEQATDQEIAQIVNFILECDESGASCALLPMMKHMYGNYVVQKLLDKASDQDRHRIECIIRHNADYLKRFTYGKHVLSRLERDCHPHFF
ncbi:hypothetical protein Poli38472_006559 [Pythium oligandrum]|uniref:PUM-HD domain-containing protein n=1 Tax=Pythium oligandrum TaxID=41045 RepID=A0A8K1FD62_PYTOL|nr:hypothetical protein Poli38472_006559 [Pythium oligandrum]|eukprot:TMW56549.1 hypothetical protein Poli38472_006559 [Pythium oligandrum]